MTDALFAHVLLPVASEDDARATCAAALPRVAAADGRVTAVHVVEKAGGAPDKASVEQREERADAIFAVVESACADAGVPVETEVVYGTDVADTVFRVADEVDAAAVVFTPRGGGWWLDLLTGDTSRDLVKRADRPVVVLPDARDGDADADADADDDTSDRSGDDDETRADDDAGGDR